MTGLRRGGKAFNLMSNAMDNDIVDRLVHCMNDFDYGDSCSLQVIRDVEKQVTIDFPQDYTEFMLRFNGGEGDVGNNAYLILWPVETILERNEDLMSDRFTPGVVLFGSNGGHRMYGFRSSGGSTQVVEVDKFDTNVDNAIEVGRSLEDLLIYLQDK